MEVITSSTIDNLTRLNTGHLIAEVAVTAAGPGCVQWSDLLPTLFEYASSDAANDRKEALTIFLRLAEYAADSLLETHVKQLYEMMEALLSDSDAQVALTSLHVTCGLICRFKNLDNKLIFEPLIPQLINILEATLNATFSGKGDEEDARMVLKDFIDVVTYEPALIRPHLEEACTAMLSIADTDDLDEQTRRLGLEFLMSLAESAGSTVRKVPELIEHIVTVSLKYLGYVEDDKQWENQEDDPNAYIGDETANNESSVLVQAGAITIDRLASAIQGQTIIPLFEAQWNNLTVSKDWKDRRTIILAFSLIMEGCKRYLAPNIKNYIDEIVPFLEDPHPRVRHAAVRCLGQMCIDFSEPNEAVNERESAALVAESMLAKDRKSATSSGLMSRIQERSHLKCIQELCGSELLTLFTKIIANNDEVPRTRGIACTAVINLVDPSYADSTIFGEDFTLAGPLFDAIFDLLNNVAEEFMLARGYALRVLSNSACVLDEDFAAVYDDIMPSLREVVMAQATNPAQRHVQMCALESLSSICQAVDRKISGEDAIECLKVIKESFENGFSNDIEAFKTNATSLVRIAACLKADFSPFYPMVMKILLPKAEAEVDFIITDPNAVKTVEELEKEKNQRKNVTGEFHEGTLNVKGLGQRHVAINSTAKEEKFVAVTALIQLLMHASPQTEACWRLVDVVAPIVLQISPFEDIRLVNAESLFYLLRAALADTKNLNHAQKIFDDIVRFSALSLQEEAKLEALYQIADCISETFELAYITNTPKYKGPEADEEEKQPGSPPNGSPTKANTFSKVNKSAQFARVTIDPVFLPGLFTIFQGIYSGSVARRLMAQESLDENPDADEVDKELLMQALSSEDELVSNVTDILGYCIKMMGEPILDILFADSTFDEDGDEIVSLGNFLLTYLEKKEDINIHMRAASICLVDDLIEFAHPASYDLLPTFLPHLKECMKHPNNGIRHPSLWGAGVLAQYGGDQIIPHINEIVDTLVECVLEENARSGEMECATDNAVSSLYRFVKYRPDNVDIETLMNGVLTYLPLKGDAIEARFIHGELIRGLANKDPVWVGEKGENVPLCITALAKALRQHKLNMTENEKAEEEGEDDDLCEELFEEEGEGSLEELEHMVNSLKGDKGAEGRSVGTIVNNLSKNLKAVMMEFGFPTA